MTKVATPVVKNKFWIVEEEGNKVGTIQAIEGGGFTYVDNGSRAKFPSITDIKKYYNLVVKGKQTKSSNSNELYGYPVDSRAYNITYNVQTGIPIYSKSAGSKSMFCAGYYCIELDPGNWISNYCPKLITVKRYPYMGPFKTEKEMVHAWNLTRQSN